MRVVSEVLRVAKDANGRIQEVEARRRQRSLSLLQRLVQVLIPGYEPADPPGFCLIEVEWVPEPPPEFGSTLSEGELELPAPEEEKGKYVIRCRNISCEGNCQVTATPSNGFTEYSCECPET